MKGVKFLEIVFENVESIVVPIERVLDFSCGDTLRLTDNMFNDGNYYKTNCLTLRISYQDEAELDYNDMDYNEPLGMFVGNPMSNNVNDRPNILGRLLNHRDIVGVWMLDKDEEVFKTIYAPWGEDEYTNTCMDIKAENGIIEISIEE